MRPRIIIAITLAAIFCGWYWGHRQYNKGQEDATQRYTIAIAQLQAKAAQELTIQTQRTRAAEQALQAATATQNTKDATNAKTISDLSARLRTLSGTAGRLRDPHATAQCGAGGGGPTPPATPAASAGAADSAQASGLLSAELSGLLRKLASEADDINAAFISCRADAYTVRVQ